ncbi:MAG: S-layer homology domain-containing protein [Demequina sp.]
MPIIPREHICATRARTERSPLIDARSHRPRLAAARTISALALSAVLVLGATPAQADALGPSVASDPAPAASPEPSPTPQSTLDPSVPTTPTPSDDPIGEGTQTPAPAPLDSTPPGGAAGPDALDTDSPEAMPRMLMAPMTVGPTSATERIAFADVSSRVGDRSYSAFTTEISWLAAIGVSEGWQLSNGTREYRPRASITRDAMAAFLYRFAGEPAHVAPVRSPFLDVRAASTSFYTEITWAAESGISKGWKGTGGSTFQPYSAITREAMAAFLYRYAGSPAVTLPRTSPFKDVPASSQFYKEIVWLNATGATTGWRTNTGAEFRPRATITREAMAAFLYRLDRAGVGYALSGMTGPLLRHSEMYVYGTATLNIRSGPSTSLPVMGQRAQGAPLTTTGSVSSDGWIEVILDGSRAWASSYYLVGTGGAAVTRAKATYSNGRIPESHLCALSWDRSEILLCQAAADLERLNRAFRARYGINIPINDSYRDYDAQVRARAVHGNLAATPGTSNHGWGAAVDIAGATLPGGYQGAPYLWLRQQLGGYNWLLPTWARPGGSKPEPWHFEYTG